jgi:tripartite-type tricarboxylate transporter receptor subunit TctC
VGSLRVASRGASDYLTRPVRWMVCFSAGGPSDTIARVIGQYLSDYLGQQFIIENRVGSGGNVGMQSALGSVPYGYTIVFVGRNNAINATLYEKLPFNFMRDSAPIAGTMRLTNVMEVIWRCPPTNLLSSRGKAQRGQAHMVEPALGKLTSFLFGFGSLSSLVANLWHLRNRFNANLDGLDHTAAKTR